MKLLTSVLALTGFVALSLPMVAHAQLGYTLDVTTEYLTGAPGGATFLGGGTPSPDTAFFVITNNGTTTYTGSVGDVAVSAFGGDQSFTASGVTLAPGQSVSVAVGPESSNQGGFNGPFGSVQPGVEIQLMGLINGTEAINLSVNDSAIHSGAPRTNPFGVTLDNYVLQGGDPLGRDTGDGYEETQAFGHFRFFQSSGSVPEPGVYAMMASLGLTGAAFLRRRRAR